MRVSKQEFKNGNGKTNRRNRKSMAIKIIIEIGDGELTDFQLSVAEKSLMRLFEENQKFSFQKLAHLLKASDTKLVVTRAYGGSLLRDYKDLTDCKSISCFDVRKASIKKSTAK
jgi:hypothetical protein